MNGALRPVALIARREFASRVKGRAFVVGTLVVLLLLGVYAAVVATLASGEDTARVGVTGPAVALTGPLERAAPTEGLTLTVVPQAEVAAGEAAVRAGTSTRWSAATRSARGSTSSPSPTPRSSA
ncbi:hypothetical protein [Actinomycetospora sp. CA-053990]|uniref:hypothetical protein n=1 Tax=Actinomycetospora sp. CA-053990 TaxID=3239891 RepID=UPI003D8B8921